MLGILFVVWVCEPNREMFNDWKFGAFFVVALLGTSVLFMLSSLLVGPIVFCPLYYLGRRLARGPFEIGDRVRILVGPHRNRVVEVYEVWESRGQIRVRLDAEAEKEVRDVFSNFAVFRESPRQRQTGERVGK